MSSDFEVVKNETLLSCFAFEVVRKTISHSGNLHHRDIASHRGAVAVVAQRNDGRVALLRQYRAAFDAVIWEIPAGTLDKAGEPALKAAQRELLEEIGCTSNHWSDLGAFMVSPGWTNQVMQLFMARSVSFSEAEPSGPEESAMTVHWLTLQEIRDVLTSGELLDSSLSIGLARSFGAQLYS